MEATYADYETTPAEPEREGLDAVADYLRMSVEKLGVMVTHLSERLGPVLKEEMEDCVAVDRLHAVRPNSSPLTTHLGETVEMLGTLQRRIADIDARIDVGR